MPWSNCIKLKLCEISAINLSVFAIQIKMMILWVKTPSRSSRIWVSFVYEYIQQSCNKSYKVKELYRLYMHCVAIFF